MATARAGRPATLVNSTMSSSRASASTRLNSAWASLSCVTAKGVPSCTAGRAQRLQRARCPRMAADAAGGDQRDLALDAGRAQEGQRLRDDVLEIEARVVQVGDPGRAEVAAGQPRVLDDDGIGQALLALPLAAPAAARRARRTGSGPARRAGGPAPGRAGPAAGRRRPPPRRCRIPAPACTDGRVVAHRAHHVDGQQAAPAGQLARGADLALAAPPGWRRRWPAWRAARPAAGRCVRAIRSGWWRRRSTDEIVPTPPSAATLPASRCADTPTPMPPCTSGSSVRPPRRSGRRPPSMAPVASGRGRCDQGRLGSSWRERQARSFAAAIAKGLTLAQRPARRIDAGQRGPDYLCSRVRWADDVAVATSSPLSEYSSALQEGHRAAGLDDAAHGATKPPARAGRRKLTLMSIDDTRTLPCSAAMTTCAIDASSIAVMKPPCTMSTVWQNSWPIWNSMRSSRFSAA